MFTVPLYPVNNKQCRMLWTVFVTDSVDLAVLSFLDTMDKVENKPHLPGKNFHPPAEFLFLSKNSQTLARP